jgi:hypothetical protein
MSTKANSQALQNPINAATLRLKDRDTRIRGMNIAAKAAREYIERAGRKERPWPARVARLVDANLSLMGQRIMARVRRYEREGKRESAEKAFEEGMREVGLMAAKEFLSKGT